MSSASDSYACPSLINPLILEMLSFCGSRKLYSSSLSLLARGSEMVKKRKVVKGLHASISLMCDCGKLHAFLHPLFLLCKMEVTYSIIVL